jgi:hypothetical protein
VPWEHEVRGSNPRTPTCIIVNIKIEIISSAFENNNYPKGVACFKATLNYNNINIEVFNTFVANSLNISDLAQADNQCQNLLIKKVISILEFINYKINNELFNKAANEKVLNDYNYTFNDYNNDYNEVIEEKNYKKKTLNLATDLGISIDKISKISYKLNGISNLNELNNNQWKEIYNFIIQKINNYKSKVSKNYNLIDNYQEYEKIEKNNIKDSIKNIKNNDELEDEEVILEDEWNEIL